jgi:flagellar protein FliO/FliZ
MTKPNLLHRAAATAPAWRRASGACLQAFPPPSGAFRRGALASVWVLAGACVPALAAKKARSSFEEQPFSTGGSSSSAAHVGGSGGSIVRTIVGLVIVIAVIWGLSWILRQIKNGRGGSGTASPSTGLTSLAALSLSSGRSVHLVRAGSDYLLLGSAEQGVVPIHRYTEEEAREAGLSDVIEPAPQPVRRRALLRAPAEPQRGGGGARTVGHDPMRMPSPGPGTSVIDRLRELTVRR